MPFAAQPLYPSPANAGTDKQLARRLCAAKIQRFFPPGLLPILVVIPISYHLMPPRPTARFTPIDPSKCLLFVGQDVSSILEYADSVRGGRNVFGITSYTALSDTPGFSLRGLRPDLGECPVDYGAGPVDSSAVLHELPFAALSLGLDLTGARLAGIAAGMHDTSLADLGRYFRDLAPRPVFLRIGTCQYPMIRGSGAVVDTRIHDAWSDP